MKKFLGMLLAMMMAFALAQSASAASVEVDDILVLTGWNSTSQAGEMIFNWEDVSNNNTINVITSFCLEIDATTVKGTPYIVKNLLEETSDKIAWLFFNYEYNPGYLSSIDNFSDDGNWTNLQYAIWSLAGPSVYTLAGVQAYITAAENAVKGGWSNNGRVLVAVNDGQDILVSNVPIPGAALLFGSFVVGLVGARRNKRKR